MRPGIVAVDDAHGWPIGAPRRYTRPRAVENSGEQGMLVEITPHAYGVEIDLVYATPLNFTGRPIYRRAACHLHPDTATLLARASDPGAAPGLPAQDLRRVPAGGGAVDSVAASARPELPRRSAPRLAAQHGSRRRSDPGRCGRRTRPRHGHRLRRHAAGLLARRYHGARRGAAQPRAAARRDDCGRASTSTATNGGTISCSSPVAGTPFSRTAS